MGVVSVLELCRIEWVYTVESARKRDQQQKRNQKSNKDLLKGKINMSRRIGGMLFIIIAFKRTGAQFPFLFLRAFVILALCSHYTNAYIIYLIDKNCRLLSRIPERVSLIN